MQKHAIIKGPPPTAEEVAQMLGLSDADVARARAWADQVLTKQAPAPDRNVRPHRMRRLSGTNIPVRLQLSCAA